MDGAAYGPRTWSEDIYVAMVATQGDFPTSGTVVQPVTKCGDASVCSVKTRTGSFSAPTPWGVGKPARGKLVMDNSKSTAAVDTIQANQTFTMTAGQLTGTLSWSTPSVRCDRIVPGRTPGCTVPLVAPYFQRLSISSPTHGQVANHILNAMVNSPNHWGWPGHGPQLHYTTDQALINANFQAACGNFVPTPGQADDSCYTYPFDVTYEGASKNSDYSVGHVAQSQRTEAQTILNGFVGDARLIEGDPFLVLLLN
jgi:hypothetical protein